MAQTREERLVRQRVYNIAHREESAAYHAIWRASNRKRLREQSAVYRAAHPEKRRESNAVYYAKHREKFAAERANPETWADTSLKDIRARAKRNGLPFDITAEDIQVPALCPFTLKPFYAGPRQGKAHPQSPSVDRIKPDKGYVRGNVRVISFLANTLKNDCTDPDVFQRLADDARLWSLV